MVLATMIPLLRTRADNCVAVFGLIAYCFTLSTYNRALAEDWPRFRGPNYDGRSTETSWLHQWSHTGPTIAWSAQVGTGFSACSISNNRLVTIGNHQDVDTVYCFDAITGDLLWKHSYPSASDPNEFEGGPTSTPTVDGGVVFVLGRSGDLLAMNLDSGMVQWHRNVATENEIPIPTWGFSGSPLVDGDRLILNVGDAGAAVNKSTGELLWKSESRECGYSSPVPIINQNQKKIILGSGRSYVCIDPSTGTLHCRQRWLTTFGCNAADPICFNIQLFLSTGYNRGSLLLDIAADEPAILWQQKQVQNQLSTSILIDQHVYGASGDVASGASLVCMEWDSGEVRWKEDSIRVGGLSAAGDRLLVISDCGQLNVVQANPQKFNLLAQSQVIDGKCWTAPVLANGHIYCRSADGQVVAIDATMSR